MASIHLGGIFMIKVENAFVEYEIDNPETFPEIFELNIVSGGCHLYGYMLTPDKMLRPLADKLEASGGNIRYESIGSNHSFIGQRMKLTKLVGKWLEDTLVK